MMTSALEQICALTHTRTLSQTVDAPHTQALLPPSIWRQNARSFIQTADRAESILKRHQLKRPRNASSIAISHSSEDGDSLGNEESRKHVR